MVLEFRCFLHDIRRQFGLAHAECRIGRALTFVFDQTSAGVLAVGKVFLLMQILACFVHAHDARVAGDFEARVRRNTGR